MVIIGVYQSSRNNDLYEHICLGKTKKIHKLDSKCDDQQQYKEIIESSMVSNNEGFTDNSPMSYGPSVTAKQPNASKSLLQLSETLDVKPKTSIHRLCAAK